jgi:hypothetical protein
LTKIKTKDIIRNVTGYLSVFHLGTLCKSWRNSIAEVVGVDGPDPSSAVKT